MIRYLRAVTGLIALPAMLWALPATAQFQGPPLGTGPWVFETFEQDYLKVSVLAKDLEHPFGLVFLPGTATEQYPLGDILFTERYVGRVRLYTQGRLVEEPVIDMTEHFPMEQLFDIVLHPDFDDNGLIYFTYIKTAPHPEGTDDYWVTTALIRGRLDGHTFVDLEEIYEADAWSSNLGGASSRLHFLEDGTLLLGVSHRIEREKPQRLDSDIGKVLRLNDDGSVPGDNPFVNEEGASPQIYTWGNRSVMDFETHPDTGEVWNLENGPQGGDEVNILRPGLNYGWPLATYGRDYDGTLFGPRPWVEGTELPFIFWVPSISVATMAFYTGDVFTAWQGNLFVTAMLEGRIPNTGHLQRIVLNEHGELRRERLLTELHQRIRFVVQGPDDLLYLLTDHPAPDGAFLRLEPGTAGEAALYAGQASTGSRELAENELVFDGYDCQTCHRNDNALLGPSYSAIAGRYALDEANLDSLATKVIQGGSGQWGDSPMNPHPDLDMATARDMVRQILSLENP